MVTLILAAVLGASPEATIRIPTHSAIVAFGVWVHNHTGDDLRHLADLYDYEVLVHSPLPISQSDCDKLRLSLRRLAVVRDLRPALDDDICWFVLTQLLNCGDGTPFYQELQDYQHRTGCTVLEWTEMKVHTKEGNKRETDARKIAAKYGF